MATTPTVIGSGGARTWWHEPVDVRFVGTHDKTYFGYVTSAGKCIIAEVDNDTGATASFELRSTAFDDDHANPTIWVRPSDRRLVVFYCGHNDTVIRYRVSTNPEDVSAWGAEQTLAVTGNVVTYPTPIFLASENGGNGRLYLFYRGANLSLCYQYSDDIYGSGVTSPTFAGDIEMVANTGGAQGVYFKVGTNFTDRIDFGLTNAIDGIANHNDVRHCIFKAEELFRSDGTTSLGSRSGGDFPLAFTDVLDVVYDSATTGYKAWVNDISYNGGSPEIVYTEFFNKFVHRYRYAKWNGSSWDDHFILWAGAQIVASTVSQPHYMAGICLDHANEGVAYACLGNNDRSTLWKLTTADGGATWAFERISSQDDGAQNIRPHVPWNLSTPGDGAHPKHPVLWMRGSYDDYIGSEYSTDIVSLNGLELDQPALTSDWSRKCAITLDAASGGSDLTDFTVLLTEANLPSEIFTEANADGSDIRFTAGSDGTGPLNFYIARFDPTDDKAEIWVRVPTLSATTGATIYVWYGSASRIAPHTFDYEYGANRAFPGYDGFWAFEEASGDSVNALSPGWNWNTGAASPTRQAAAKYGRGLTTSNDSIGMVIGSGGLLPPKTRSIEFGGWFTVTASAAGFILNARASEGGRVGFEFLLGSVSAGSIILRAQGTGGEATVTKTGLNDGALHYIVGALKPPAPSRTELFVDGASQGSSSTTLTSINSLGPTNLASRSGANFANETIDHLFIRDAKGAGFIATEYANQNDPAGFATAGTPENVDGSVDPTPVPVFMSHYRQMRAA